jgi:hypothetical protein
VSDRRTIRRIVALLCLAAILLISLGQADHGLPLAVLVPFWIVLATILAVAILPLEDARPALLPVAARVLASRAPPAR